MIKIFNIQKSYSFPLIQLRGCVHSSIKSDKIFVCLNSNANHWPIIDYNFKILVHLEKDFNELKVWVKSDSNKRIAKQKFNITFKQSLNKKFIRVLYLVCDKSSDNLFENGCFQSPECEDNCIESGLKRIALNVLLSQCFFAQTLPNYKTFQLELNQNNYPKIHVFKLNESIEKIWSLDSYQLWECVAKQIMSSVLAENQCKYLAFCSFTRYYSNSLTNKLTKFSDLLNEVKGYSSLGGGGLALLGTACLYTWPSVMSDITNRFQDLRPVDRKNFMDDSNQRGSLGGCYATTLGAMVHELAHILDLGHSESGIMSLDLHFINSFFVMESNSVKDIKDIKWWNSSQICILSNHKWIHCFKVSQNDKNDNLFEVERNRIKSHFGIIAIEYRDSTDNRTVDSQLFTLGAKCVQLKPMDKTIVFAIDSNGNTFKHNLN